MVQVYKGIVLQQSPILVTLADGYSCGYQPVLEAEQCKVDEIAQPTERPQNASVLTSYSFSGSSTQRQRSVSIPKYVLQASSARFSAHSLTTTDVVLVQAYTNTGNGSNHRYSLDVNGSGSGEQTDNTTVIVSTLALLNRVPRYGPMETENTPFNGQLGMMTSDD